MDIENFKPPGFITFAIPFFFLLMLVELIVGKMKKESYFHFGDSIADLSTGILSQISGIFLKVFSLFFYFYVYEHFRLFTIEKDSVLGWILAIVLWDFCYYWLHRLAHEVNFFWAGHVIHHHSEEYNLIVALRQTSLGGLSSWIFFIPMAVLGIEPWLFLAAGQINLIYQYWVHTKSVKSIGKVGEFLLSTPSHHRVHHAINPEYIDKNHGGIFIIWDRMFGTFRKEEAVPVYGTVKPLKSYNPLWANYHYYWELCKTSWNASGYLNKILIWIKPPGWYPGADGSPSGFFPIPEVDHKTFEKYDPNPSKQMKVYSISWFIITLLLSFGFIVFHSKLDMESKIYSAIWITLSLLNINGFLESRIWVKSLEFVRLFISPLIIWFLSGDMILTITGILISLLSIIFLIRQK